MKLRSSVPGVGRRTGKVVYYKPRKRRQLVMTTVAGQCGLRNKIKLMKLRFRGHQRLWRV